MGFKEEDEIDQKLNSIEKEWQNLRLINVINDLQQLITSLKTDDQNVIRETIKIISTQRETMNIKQLEEKADQLHIENVKAVDELKQIVNQKERVKRSRPKNQKVSE